MDKNRKLGWRQPTCVIISVFKIIRDIGVRHKTASYRGITFAKLGTLIGWTRISISQKLEKVWNITEKATLFVKNRPFSMISKVLQQEGRREQILVESATKFYPDQKGCKAVNFRLEKISREMRFWVQDFIA